VALHFGLHAILPLVSFWAAFFSLESGLVMMKVNVGKRLARYSRCPSDDRYLTGIASKVIHADFDTDFNQG
jgi:hypothetical protein